jgi:hypothetical protein
MTSRTGLTSLAMGASALALLAHGIALLFAPDIVFRFFDVAAGPVGPAAAQLLGAALMGFGLMSWAGRNLVLGGIYGRPLVYGNFAHYFIGALVSIRAHLGGFGNGYFWIEVALYAGFAVLFGFFLFGSSPAVPTSGAASSGPR